MIHASLRPLPIVAAAILAWATLTHAGPPSRGEREFPREKVKPAELNQIAAEHGDRALVGATTESGVTPLGPGGLSWSALGPRPVTAEYWSGNAEASGRVSCVVVHPTDPNRAYLAAAQGGVWKTTDGGTTWTPLTDALSSLASGWLAFDPGNPQILYYGTGEQHYSTDSYYGDGLFRTNNGGNTWTKIATKAAVGSYIARVLVDPASSSRLFVASDRGVVRSVDGGSTWTVVYGGPESWGNDLVFDPVSSAVIYAGMYGLGVVESSDGGDHWTTLGGGLPAAGTFSRVNIAIAPSNRLVLYASFVDPNENLLGMYRTADGGATWTRLDATPNYMVSQGSYDNCMIVSRTDPNVVYAGGVFPYDPSAGDAGVIKTTDGGASWTDITVGTDGSQVHPDEHAMAFGTDGALWLVGDGGVWKTLDGGATWLDKNGDLAVTQFYRLGIHPTDPNQMVGGTQDQGTLFYQGSAAWPQLVGGDGGPCAYDPRDPDLVFTTYVFMWYLERYRQYAYEADVTGPWQAAHERASWGSGPLTFDPHRASTVLAGTYHVWRSFDDGNSWASISPDLTNGGNLRAIAICPAVPGSYYTGSSDGAVFFTSDDGVSWQSRSTGLPNAVIPAVAVGPRDALTAYTCAKTASGDRVFKTVNAGIAWTSITGNLPSGLSPHSLAVDFRPNPDKLYLGTDYGLWTSADGGVTWTKDSAGLPNCAVPDLRLDIPNDRIVAATYGRGIWMAPLGVGPVAVASAPDARWALDPVRPQPARASVDLQYHLPRAAPVALEMFDVRGRRVRVIDAGWREAGTHQARWEGNDGAGARVASGIYFVRLSMGADLATQRLVFVR